MEASPSNRMSRRTWIIVALVVAAALFLAGLIPGWLNAREARREATASAEKFTRNEELLAQIRLDLDIARLRGKLGEVLYEANRNNYASAATVASQFFDGVQSAIGNAALQQGSERQQVLRQVLNRRDEIAADLARADAAVKDKLAAMYVEFGRAVETSSPPPTS